MLLARGQQARVNTCDVAPPEDMVDVVARKMLYMARARISLSQGRGVRAHLFSVTVGWGIIAEKPSSLPLCPLVASCAERCVDDRHRLTKTNERCVLVKLSFCSCPYTAAVTAARRLWRGQCVCFALVGAG